MHPNDDLIELHQHHGSGEDNQPSTSRMYNYTRSRSASMHLQPPRSLSVNRDDNRPFVPLNEDDTGSVQLEHYAAEIVRRMEEDEALMEDNPVSEHLRMETLRDMPQCLTLKRSVKAKLSKSVSKKSKRRPLGFLKRCKYQISMTFTIFQTAIKNLIYSFELWYSSLKAIEGHFGSGVATYFKFLRWIFVMNFLISIPTFLFLFLPQVIYRFYEPDVSHTTRTNLLDENNQTMLAEKFGENIFRMAPKADPYKQNMQFSFVNIITGEGFLTNTTLYYGFYTNESISIDPNTAYSMPHAYFFTMLCSYAIAFVVLSISMARSYRRSFIETSGGLKNVYAHKVFCGWDYSIATKEGAQLKSNAIYNELKELLSDDDTKSRKMSFLSLFWTRSIQGAIHSIIFLLITGTAFLMWELLEKHRGAPDINENSDLRSASVITAFVVTIIMTVGPLFFTWIVKFEDYKNPRTALYVSLMRTFLLEVVVISVLVTFWLNSAQKAQCWETSLGQEVYRLILIDFFISVVFTSLLEILRHLIYKYIWKRIGVPEFDIARHTLQIIYNQTLFWVGFYFSPLLALVVTLKFWCTWYLKRLSCLHCCKPSTKSWRAAQTQTIFLVMAFLALFAVIIVIGYIMTQVKTSNSCGPFRNHEYIYEMILEGIFQLQKDHGVVKFLMFLTKPGVITGLLIAMSVRVYYLRAKSNAQRGVVELLREMLKIEAKDKEFLLTNISKVTEGTWMYNLNRSTYGRDNMHSEPSNSWQLHNNQARRLPKYDFHDLTFSSDRFNRNYIDNDIQRNRAYRNRENY